MPSATGTWVALWLLNKDYSISNPAAEWPSGGEIDINGIFRTRYRRWLLGQLTLEAI